MLAEYERHGSLQSRVHTDGAPVNKRVRIGCGHRVVRDSGLLFLQDAEEIFNSQAGVFFPLTTGILPIAIALCCEIGPLGAVFLLLGLSLFFAMSITPTVVD